LRKSPGSEPPKSFVRTKDRLPCRIHTLEKSADGSCTGSNRLELFRRTPSNLRRYRQYVHSLKQNYGTINDYILSHVLGWTDNGTTYPPFTNPDDIKILYNDWPYGFERSITHLVVWTKFDFPVDPATDEMTADAWNAIATFVDQVFGTRFGEENVR
jgi:Protein of unknown function (DUF3605)